MPRYYTIASSNLMYPDEIKIALSLDKDILPDGTEKEGLTSKYMNDIYQTKNFKGTKCRIFVKDSLFYIPSDPMTPMIMIGPGTGVVPFIAFM